MAEETDQLSFSGAPATKEQLGEKLFFEKMLSADRSASCASCHIPAYGFADTAALSRGVGGHLGVRNSPSCANMSERPYLFYDGRAATLEEQVRFPIEDTNEMALPINEAVKRLRANKQYVEWFKKIFGEGPTERNLKVAIAAFERTLETSRTLFDRYMDGDSMAISASAIRGRELFMSKKAKCFDCHFSPDFTGDEFRNIGLYDGVRYTDKGRYAITKKEEDMGKFKVPGLRNVSVTAPYMHNGMFRTLAEVIEYYDDPYKVVPAPVNMDTLMVEPLHLTAEEKKDLENFLLTLTDDRFKK
ncbi:cytochrome c peroxidase [Nemorincola caseinilytica]|uniref:Cytochrome c peroxidase n=2 Tax=Nemorincola caseinilytica TaxID=2054315 RepID=A0ABP8NFR2_9BACT